MEKGLGYRRACKKGDAEASPLQLQTAVEFGRTGTLEILRTVRPAG
jgi:hypothetical protein